MNQSRRNRLKTALEMLSSASSIVSMAYDMESDALGNIPESFESTDRYAKMEDAVDNLSDAGESIDNAIESLEKAIA